MRPDFAIGQYCRSHDLITLNLDHNATHIADPTAWRTVPNLGCGHSHQGWFKQAAIRPGFHRPQIRLHQVVHIRSWYFRPRAIRRSTVRFFASRHCLILHILPRSFDAGQEVFARYSKLVSSDNLPFIRSDGSDRVVDTATNWTAGFASASRNAIQPKLDLILPQTVRVSTLCMCSFLIFF